VPRGRHLRGHAPTRFLDPATAVVGSRRAGADVVDLVDAPALPRAVLAGHDGAGGLRHRRAGSERCAGLVSVDSNLSRRPGAFVEAVLDGARLDARAGGARD
jgi:hypothetical protein